MSKHFNEDNFDQEVIQASASKPVLVDFFAAWCGPCKMQGPIVDELAESIGEKASVGKVDTEEASEIAMKYQIRSIPTIMIFKGGEVVEQFVGMQSKEALQSALEKHM